MRVNNATGGTFTLTFDGQTTAPIAVQRDRGARSRPRSRRSRNIGPGDVIVTGGTGQHRQRDGQLPTAQYARAERRRSSPPTAPALTGTTPTVAATTRSEGDLFNAPFVDARRSVAATPTTCAARCCASRSTPTAPTRARPATCSRARDARKTRPEIYAMGFRNPFRIQVDDNDVAYVTDYSPDSNDAGELPRAGRHRPRRDRAQAVQLRLAALLRAGPAVLPLELQHQHAAGRRRRRRTSAATRSAGPQNTSRWNTAAASSRLDARRSPSRTSGTRSATTPTRRWARRASAYYDGSGGTCPQLFPELVHRRRRPARRGAVPATTPTTRARRSSRRTTTARSSSASSAQDTLREVRLDADRARSSRSTSCSTAAPSRSTRDAAVRVRQPDGHAVRRRRQLLPADLRRRLLRRQPGRRHVPVGVRQGPARAAGRARTPRRPTASRR